MVSYQTLLAVIGLAIVTQFIVELIRRKYYQRPEMRIKYLKNKRIKTTFMKIQDNITCAEMIAHAILCMNRLENGPMQDTLDVVLMELKKLRSNGSNDMI